jgi:hypothetical protein
VHYKLGRDIIIRTENAAKPHNQNSAYLKSLILSLETVSSSFDYGCGKLRYKDAILRVTDTLALVDSEVQIGREQMICGERTTIRASVQRSNRANAYNTTEFARLQSKFDRGFCINVLSIIPIAAARQRVLHLIRAKLHTGGTCLFVVQYRNSDFTRMRALPNARSFLDGFLINSSSHGHSFYGLISPERLGAMVVNAGFEIIDQKLNEGSVYMITRSPGQVSSLGVMDENNNFQVVKQRRRGDG